MGEGERVLLKACSSVVIARNAGGRRRRRCPEENVSRPRNRGLYEQACIGMCCVRTMQDVGGWRDRQPGDIGCLSMKVFRE